MLKTVAKIEKSFSNNAYHPWPVAWLVLECGHSAEADYDYEKSAHDDANHRIKPGAQVDCTYCNHNAESLAKLRAPDARERYSHSRFRHNDSRGFGPGRLYVYEIDRSSPTKCRLWLSLDDTPEAVEALRRLGSSPLSPTEKR